MRGFIQPRSQRESWTINVFPLKGLKGLKGERIPTRGKRVFERRPGSPVKNMDLPCKGNGTVNTVSSSFHRTREDLRWVAPVACLEATGVARHKKLQTQHRSEFSRVESTDESSITHCMSIWSHFPSFVGADF